jgi:signal transduction histidine kinase
MGYRGHYKKFDLERWFSQLLENTAIMDMASSVDDAYDRLATLMAGAAGVDSCIIFQQEVDNRFKAVARHAVAEGFDRAVLTGEAAESLKKKMPAITGAKELGLPDTEANRRTRFLCMPILFHKRPASMAVLFSPGKSIEFPADTIERLSIIAVHGAHTIDELSYVDELKRRRDELRRLYEIQRRITQTIDFEKATESIVENAPYITKLKYCMIYLLDPAGRNIVSVKAPTEVERKFGKLTFRLDELVASRIAMDERKPLFIEDAPAYPNISQRIVRMLGFKSAIVLPLIAREKVLGVMWLYSTDRKVTFSEDDRRSAMALADQAAIVIDNARIFKELEESYEKLKDLDKMKMDFFTLISHELRNPLAVIRGFTELLYDGMLGPLNDRQKEKLQRIMENVDKMADMVGKMSEVSIVETKRYPLERVPVSLSDMVGGLVREMSFLFKNKRITLKVDIPQSLPLVEVDREKMEQVLLNLLNNALKYTPEGGEVSIAARDQVNEIVVSVHDTGIGIPRKDLDKIFSGFYHAGYKLSYEYKGPGLGLAVSRRIVEGHGGRIWAESEEGKGSTFYFTIPKSPIIKR